MIKNEYFRLLKSKSTIIILILLIGLSLISFFMSLSEKNVFLDQFQNSFSEDLNRTALKNLLESYTGIRFLFNYWFESDFSQIAIMIIYAWAGVFLSHELFSKKENGYGNMIVCRITYKEYFFNIISAQSIYIFTIVITSTLLQTLIAMIMGGFTFNGVSIGGYQLDLKETFLIFILQIIIISLHTITINIIATSCSCFIKNKYLIQSVPLFFAIVPTIISSTLGNISTFISSFIFYFEVHSVTNMISNIFNASFNSTEIIFSMLPLITFSLLSVVLILINIKQTKRDYI